MGTTPQRKGDPPGSTWRFHGQRIDLKRLTNITISTYGISKKIDQKRKSVDTNYLNFAQINDNELRPEQGEQTRGQSFGKWVRWVEYDL